MNNIDIIRACEAHIDDIMIIENLSFKIPWSRQSMIEEITKNKFAIYMCARTSTQTVGYAGMWHICDEGHITNIAVHPEFRGSGIGSALMESLINLAEDAGIRDLTLEVRKSDIAAQALYRKYGFKDEGIRKGYYADNNEDAIIMWKKV